MNPGSTTLIFDISSLELIFFFIISAIIIGSFLKILDKDNAMFEDQVPCESIFGF